MYRSGTVKLYEAAMLSSPMDPNHAFETLRRVLTDTLSRPNTIGEGHVDTARTRVNEALLRRSGQIQCPATEHPGNWSCCEDEDLSKLSVDRYASRLTFGRVRAERARDLECQREQVAVAGVRGSTMIKSFQDQVVWVD